LTELKKKEDKEGKFHANKGILDVRSNEQKGTAQLHNGYSIMCGTKGSKLSGGQK
jgi:ABC-type bacteriocin/lantibiotic exporter with double-glycine peptidase domain